MTAKWEGRKGRPWRRLCVLVLQTYGPVCWICREPIDLRLAWPDPRSRSTHHYPVPRSKGGRAVLTNLRPAHLGCNSSVGNRTGPTTRHTSYEW